jgi:putative heme-binding domain-containing protein
MNVNLLWLAVTLAGLLAFSAPAQEQKSAGGLSALVDVLKQSDDPQFQQDILKGMSDGLKGRRGLTMPAGWDELSTRLSQSPNSQVRELVQSLSLTFGSATALKSLREKLADPKASVASRKSALDSLVGAKDPNLVPTLQRLLEDAAMRSPALRALAAYDDPKTPALLLKMYPGFTGVEKQEALNTLASRVAFAKQLLTAVDQKVISHRDLTADIVRQLRNLKQPEINDQVQKLWGTTRESEAAKLAEIAKYKTMLQSKGLGDAPHGRAIFARTCQQCHTLFDVGGKVGPDITGSNRRDLDYILQNIIDPNAVIPNDYRTSTLETKDDRIITGIVTRQDDNAVTIVVPGETIIVGRRDIKSLTQGEISMMPEGLLATMNEGEVRDLIGYLASPAQVPMFATADNIGTFFNGKDLSGWEGNLEHWRVENNEIVGKTDGLKHNEWLSGPLLLGDFRFVCKARLTPNKENSGIQFRSQRLPDGDVKGYQADVGAGWWGKLYEEHGRGLIWDKSGEAGVKPDEWNTYEIVAVGSRIRTAINGNSCVEIDDPQGAKHGIIAFQLHSGGAFEVRYKDLVLELNPKSDLTTVVKR